MFNEISYETLVIALFILVFSRTAIFKKEKKNLVKTHRCVVIVVS